MLPWPLDSRVITEGVSEFSFTDRTVNVTRLSSHKGSLCYTLIDYQTENKHIISFERCVVSYIWE